MANEQHNRYPEQTCTYQTYAGQVSLSAHPVSALGLAQLVLIVDIASVGEMESGLHRAAFGLYGHALVHLLAIAYQARTER